MIVWSVMTTGMSAPRLAHFDSPEMYEYMFEPSNATISVDTELPSVASPTPAAMLPPVRIDVLSDVYPQRRDTSPVCVRIPFDNACNLPGISCLGSVLV